MSRGVTGVTYALVMTTLSLGRNYLGWKEAREQVAAGVQGSVFPWRAGSARARRSRQYSSESQDKHLMDSKGQSVAIPHD